MGALFTGTLVAVPWPDTTVAKHEHLQETICMALLLGCDLKVSHRQTRGDIRAIRSNCHSQQGYRVGLGHCFLRQITRSGLRLVTAPATQPASHGLGIGYHSPSVPYATVAAAPPVPVLGSHFLR